MRVFVTWLLAMGLAVSPALAGDDTKKDTTKDTAKTATSNSTPDSTAAAAATPNPALEAELQQMRDLLKAQSDQLEQQRAALTRAVEEVKALESTA